MSEVAIALGIWLPLGTVGPFILSRVTGADWRGAFIEACIFATLGVLIFPIMIAMTFALFTRSPNVDIVFAISYILGAISILLFRRRSNRLTNERRYGIR
ncbi:MAG: hypothetical protein WD401_05630 [Thermomicrobiaceae bacterium]